MSFTDLITNPNREKLIGELADIFCGDDQTISGSFPRKLVGRYLSVLSDENLAELKNFYDGENGFNYTHEGVLHEVVHRLAQIGRSYASATARMVIKPEGFDPDSIDSVVNRISEKIDKWFINNHVPEDERAERRKAIMQSIVNEGSIVEIMLTAHPTDAAQFKTISLLMDLEEQLGRDGSVEELDRIFREMARDNLVSDKRKTPDQEEELARRAYGWIQTHEDVIKEELRNALDNNGFGDVTLPERHNKIHLWPKGDADGNPNVNAGELAKGYASLPNGAIIDLRHNAKYHDEGDPNYQFAIERLKVAAQNKGKSEYLIIAESKSADDFINAIQAQLVAGIEMKDTLDVVLLLESVEDCKNAGKIFNELKSNPLFLEYIKHHKEIPVMMAGSDIPRVDGPFGGYFKSQAITDITEELAEIGVKTRYIFGGGFEANRSLGNVNLVPGQIIAAQRRAGYAAIDEHLELVGHPIRTVQGQAILLDTAFGTPGFFSLESMIARQLLALASVPFVELLDHRSNDDTINLSDAKKRGKNLAEAGVEKYHEIVTDERIVNLFAGNGPVISTLLQNDGSRPPSRNGVDLDDWGNLAYSDYRSAGKNPLEMRAISNDFFMSMFGINFNSFAGVAEAVDVVIKADDPANRRFLLSNLAKGDEMIRERAESIAMGLYLADFDAAWRFIDSERPNRGQLSSLSEFYKNKAIPEGYTQDQVTLAYLEDSALRAAEAVLYMVGGDKEPNKEIDLKAPLRAISETIADKLDRRAESVKAEREMIINAELHFREHPEEKIPNGVLIRLKAAASSWLLALKPPSSFMARDAEISPRIGAYTALIEGFRDTPDIFKQLDDPLQAGLVHD
jgi:hypothetical protein